MPNTICSGHPTKSGRANTLLTCAMSEPVVIEKSGHPAVVMLSIAEFERLQALDDAYWGEMAYQALVDGLMGADDTLRRLQARIDAPA